jgi:hypothetical protein
MKPKKESEQRGATFAKGGSGRMLPEQAANSQKAARTGHAVKGGAPGKRGAGRWPSNPWRIGGGAGQARPDRPANVRCQCSPSP